MKIYRVTAREVLDSRGNPTVEAEIKSSSSATAMVPSGASTGRKEAVELRDGGKRYGGKGVLNAVRNVNSAIAKAIEGKDFATQKELDDFLIALDGTPNKCRLGANAILAVSMAYCRLSAMDSGKELYEHISSLSKRKASLPVPQMNIINGGRHAGFENDVQEHLILPAKAKSFQEAVQTCTEVYHALGKTLKEKFGASAVHLADEGGFAPPLKNAEDRLEIILKSAEESGHKIDLALDCASSEFYKNGAYTLGNKTYTPEELIDYYKNLASKFGIVSIEDGLAEDDWNGWVELTNSLGKKIQIVGDDLLCTNPEYIIKAREMKACNALILKPNQIGTVTETLDAALLVFDKKWNVVVSHRSGETEDAFIADLAAGIGAQQCKFGAPARSERTAKYNRLLKIEDLLKP